MVRLRRSEHRPVKQREEAGRDARWVRSLAAVITGLVLAVSPVGAAHAGGGATDSGVQRGAFRAGDGAVIEYFTHGTPSGSAILISPAFTGDAGVYAERLGEALPDDYVVAVQLRGHGRSGGCSFRGSDLCSPHQGPGQGTYLDVGMSRLAKDLREAKDHLGLQSVGLIGHSLGWNVVSEYIVEYGLADVDALFAYDQSPKNLAGGGDSGSDFPAGVATYPRRQAWKFSRQMEVFRNGSYPEVAQSIRAMLGGSTGNPVLDPDTLAAAFLSTQESWRQWRRFANRINGHVLSRMFWSSITSDYTGVYRLVRDAGVPMLVYGGRSSVVPWQAMQWVHDQVPGSEFMLFGPADGVHGAFLNTGPSGERFMSQVRSFFDRHR